jgi:DNA methyltransferase 1-associated protein 1
MLLPSVAEFNPMPTEEMVQNFNELRQDIVLLYELKLALASCDYDQQMLRHSFDTLNPHSKVGYSASIFACVYKYIRIVS